MIVELVVMLLLKVWTTLKSVPVCICLKLPFPAYYATKAIMLLRRIVYHHLYEVIYAIRSKALDKLHS